MKTRNLIINIMIFTMLTSFVLQIATYAGKVNSKKDFSGVVYAAGIPVSGATVAAYGSEGSGFAVTNPSGQYTITEGLGSGTYNVMISRDGYVNEEIENVVVNVGFETSNVNAYLTRSGGISGKVTDAVTSFGIPNTYVMASLSNGSGTYFGVAMTDLTGNYRMTMNLGTGDYNVSIFMPQGYVGKIEGPFSVTAGVMTTGVDIELARSGRISGRITTPGGQPLANLTVTAYSMGGGGMYFGSDETNATGYYRIDSGLGTADYTVMVMSGFHFNTTDVSVTAGAETSNVNLQLDVTPPEPSGIIMGRITDAGEGIENAYVWAEGDTTVGSGSAHTDENGYYTISEGLVTDTYTVYASATGYQDNNVTGVDVTVSQITPSVNIQLTKIPAAQSGRISGTITGDDNPLPEFQYPIALMLILTLITALLVRTQKSTGRKKESPVF